MQAAADRAIRKWVRPSDAPVAAEALVQPGTGAIKAMAASRRYGRDAKKNEISYNLVADAHTEAASASRPAPPSRSSPC